MAIIASSTQPLPVDVSDIYGLRLKNIQLSVSQKIYGAKKINITTSMMEVGINGVCDCLVPALEAYDNASGPEEK